MLTFEQFRSLAVGDKVEMGQVFPKLSEEPITWTVQAKQAESVVFEARYFGILLGIWTCVAVDGELAWVDQ